MLWFFDDRRMSNVEVFFRSTVAHTGSGRSMSELMGEPHNSSGVTSDIRLIGKK